MMKREIAYKTENTNIIAGVLLNQNDLKILNLSHISSLNHST